MKRNIFIIALLGGLFLSCSKDSEKVIERVEVQKGSQIFSGNGVPNSSLGTIGDYYFDKSTMSLYGAKTTEGWGTPVSLKGSQGEAGQNGSKILSGTTVPPTTQGDIGDWYIDTLNKRFYGPKKENGWGDGISLLGTSNTTQKADFLISEDGTTLLQWRNKNAESIDMTSIPELANITKIGNNAFENCVELSSIKMTENITYIGHYAFKYCHKLTEIHIPKNVTTLGNYLFDRTGNLYNLYVEAVTPPTFKTIRLYGMDNDPVSLGNYPLPFGNIYVPESSLNAYKNNEQWKKIAEIIEYDSNTQQMIVKGTKLKAIP